MDRQSMASRKIQRKEKKNKSINKEEYFACKQVSDESEQIEKSCLTEEESYLSDGNSQISKKRRSEVMSCESKKIKKHKPNKEFCYDALFDDWLFGNINQKKINVTNDKADIENLEDVKLQRSSGGDSLFPRAQFLSEVGVYALPYTVLF